MATATARKTRSASTVPAAALRHALRVVAPALPTRSTKPVLHNVLVADGWAEGTDGELRIRAVVHGGQFDTPLLLPADRLVRILSHCNGEITVRASGDSCEVSGCGNKWTLPTSDPVEFPRDVERKVKPLARVPADQLSRAITAVVCAAGKHVSTGVLLEVRDGTVTLAATDGRRLHWHSFDIDQAVDDVSIVVPSRFMAALVRLAEQAGEDNAVQLETDGLVLVASAPEAVLTAPLSASGFVDWRKVAPEAAAEATHVPAAALLDATLAAAITTSETSRGVSYAFGQPAGIVLSSRSSERGESRVVCDVQEQGEQCTVVLNPDFVREFLETADPSEVVTIEATTAEKHVVLRTESTVCVLAPIVQE